MIEPERSDRAQRRAGAARRLCPLLDAELAAGRIQPGARGRDCRGEPARLAGPRRLWSDRQHYPEANARHYAFMLEGLAETEQALRAAGDRLCHPSRQPRRCGARTGAACGARRLRPRVPAPAAALARTCRGRSRAPRAAGRRRRCRSGRAGLDQAGDRCANTPPQTVAGARPVPAPASPSAPPPARRAARNPPAMSTSPIFPRCLRGCGSTTVCPPVGTSGVGTARPSGASTISSRSGCRTMSLHALIPAKPEVSTLSPYLHFGQISPVEIALAARGADSSERKQCLLSRGIDRPP